MRLTALLLFFFLPCAFSAVSAHAADAEMRTGFGLHAGAYLGMGEMGGSSSVSRHSQGTFNLEAMPGWRFHHNLMVGLLADFRAQSQLDDATKEGGADYTGRSALFGVGALFEPGRIKLLLSYDPIDRHFLSGSGITYQGSGFHALVGYKFEPNWSADLQFTQAHYNSMVFNGDHSDLSGADLHHWNLAVGASYSY